MRARRAWLLSILALQSGCEGCDSGPATRFCLQALDGIDASPREDARCVCDSDFSVSAAPNDARRSRETPPGAISST